MRITRCQMKHQLIEVLVRICWQGRFKTFIQLLMFNLHKMVQQDKIRKIGIFTLKVSIIIYTFTTEKKDCFLTKLRQPKPCPSSAHPRCACPRCTSYILHHNL
jgi:hypothetical protein